MKALSALVAFSGAMAVMAGAFGAHAAHGAAAEWLKTGAQYQMIHAVAALVAARMGMRWAAGLLVGGSILFAGSLYGFALGGPHWLGPVTPLGGLGMIAGWVWLGVALAKRDSSS